MSFWKVYNCNSWQWRQFLLWRYFGNHIISTFKCVWEKTDVPHDLIHLLICCWHSQGSLSHAQPSIVVIVRLPFSKSNKLPQFLAAVHHNFLTMLPSLYLREFFRIYYQWLCCHHCIIMNFSGFITNDQGKAHANGHDWRSKVKVTEVATQLDSFQTPNGHMMQ